MPIFYSASTGGFYSAAIHGDNIPADAVEITAEQHQALIDGQSSGKVIATDADGFPVLQDPPPPPPPAPKLTGIDIDGVMCSATRDDQNGLVAVIVAYQLQQEKFQPTEFQFVNGNKILLTAKNLPQFLAAWMPFRQSFFKPEAA